MWRAYFFLGDLLACTVTGAVAAGVVQAAVPADWFMILGMVAGMALGMAVGMVGTFVFSPLFGALEVVLPVILAAMVGGMGAGMSETMTPGIDGISWGQAMQGGAYTGMAIFAFTYFFQALTQGDVKGREGKR